MGSLYGNIQRPVVAAAAVAVASVSSDLQDKLRLPKLLDASSSLEQSSNAVSDSLHDTKWLRASNISVSKLADLSFVARIRVPVPNMTSLVLNLNCSSVPKSSCSSIASNVLLNSYRSAELLNCAQTNKFKDGGSNSASSTEVVYRWHLPDPNAVDVSKNSGCSSVKSRTVVVLLGWLGAKQKHMNRYAEWYTSRGYHVISFTFPMAEILSYQVGGKAEQHIDSLVNHLTDWLEEEDRKNLVFHTFSNTGWLTYGAILEQFQKQDPSLMGKVRGCIVDSAPVATPDAQVWASGFSAAFLKKRSIATKGANSPGEPGVNTSLGTKSIAEAKPAVTEAALLLVLEKFFEVVLNLPAINRRLSDVLDLLTSGQPSCPQLYIYSSADKVIPAGSVESFVEEQRRSGREPQSRTIVSDEEQMLPTASALRIGFSYSSTGHTLEVHEVFLFKSSKQMQELLTSARFHWCMFTLLVAICILYRALDAYEPDISSWLEL